MNLSLLEGSPIKVSFNDLTSGTPSKSFKCNGNINTALISVENATTVDLLVEGCVNDMNGKEPLQDGDCTWVSLAVLNTKDYSLAENITDNGAYNVALGGFARVRINPTTIEGTTQVTLVRVE